MDGSEKIYFEKILSTLGEINEKVESGGSEPSEGKVKVGTVHSRDGEFFNYNTFSFANPLDYNFLIVRTNDPYDNSSGRPAPDPNRNFAAAFILKTNDGYYSCGDSNLRCCDTFTMSMAGNEVVITTTGNSFEGTNFYPVIPTGKLYKVYYWEGTL